MAYTIEKILGDAKVLVNRLKDHDGLADNLISNTQTLHKRVDAMKQFEEDLNELNEIARHKPRAALVLSIAQENREIRELQHENKELRMLLEEHQSALELIMSKYRKQMLKLMMANKVDVTVMGKDNSKHLNDIRGKIDKICEMATIMQQAVAIDDKHGSEDKRRMTKLELENKGLRELLEISVTIGDSTAALEKIDQAIQTDLYKELSLDESIGDSLNASQTSLNTSMLSINSINSVIEVPINNSSPTPSKEGSPNPETKVT